MSVAEEKITQLLNSPEGLGKIAEIAKSLTQSGIMNTSVTGGEPEKKADDIPRATEEEQKVSIEEAHPEPEAVETFRKTPYGIPDISGLIEGFKLNPVFLKSIGRAAQGFDDNERRVVLLNAFKPFSHGKSSGTLERAISAIKIARAARLFMDNQ